MAILRDKKTGERRPIPARLLVGRSAACGLALSDLHVSGEHAALIWSGSGGEVRDLGSRNGTFVDGDRLGPGSARSLISGTELCFGHLDTAWIVDDTGAPSAVAVAVDTGELVAAVDGMIPLPSDTRPELVVFADGRGGWQIDATDGPEPVHDGRVVNAGQRSWRLRVPEASPGTATIDHGPTLDTVSLTFAVSRDEEHVAVTVEHRGRSIPLESREHGYLMVTLARARLADAEEPLAEQGWLDRDRLLKMVMLDANALNVAIYRARRQLAAAGVDGAAAVVEVRRGQRRLGLEPSRIRVVRM